ncbi:hypothetical protein [Blastococcus brunescens]|uniref:Uncharacterized protein n=1 Tax=Blastococcus brunescens TaxID=1564165 RepID=A0ABZ1B3K3_9ACTN|nr:hypothetical protein [Blastococcus sp. BMG 8361]WRL65385.1 hypothetical protein U6N30_07050 [Blastococcus sp. BMG 8361]
MEAGLSRSQKGYLGRLGQSSKPRPGGVRKNARTEQDRHEHDRSEQEHPCWSRAAAWADHAAANPVAIPVVASSGLSFQYISTTTRR